MLLKHETFQRSNCDLNTFAGTSCSSDVVFAASQVWHGASCIPPKATLF